MSEPRTPEEVFAHHGQVLGAGDIEGIVSDYSDDAIFISPDGILRVPAAAFLQTNSAMCEVLYATALRFAAPEPARPSVDLYLGLSRITGSGKQRCRDDRKYKEPTQQRRRSGPHKIKLRMLLQKPAGLASGFVAIAIRPGPHRAQR